MTIDFATAVTGVYDFKLRAEIKDDLGALTGRFEVQQFKVWVYDLAPSTPSDVIYIINTPADSVTIPSFSKTHVDAAGYTLTYSIEAFDGASWVNAETYHSWITSFDQAQLKINYQTADLAKAGEYTIRVRGSLNDTPVTTVFADFKFYLIALTATAQSPIVYLLTSAPKT